MASTTIKATAVSTAIAIALGTAPPVLAQEDDSIEEITVTGSHIRRTEYEGRAPIQIMDAEAIELIGAAQPVEVLKALTVNSGSQFYNETNNRAGVSQFNIRNLGLGSTLTLINGKRAGIAAVADDSGTDFVDINQFPLAMIERIEILTNGASATYGSQAVAGVANIITRKGMEGIEISGGYSTSEIEAFNINLAAGAQFEQGGFNIYMTYMEQGNQGRSELPFLQDRLNGAGIGGRSRFLSGTGSPGSVELATLGPDGEAISVAGAIREPDPDCVGAGGVIGDPIDTGLNPNTCRYNFADQVSVIAAEERAQVFTEFDWEFSDKVKYYAEASFSSNIIKTDNGGQLLATGRAGGGATTILPSHPFNFFIEDDQVANPGGLVYIGPENWDPAIHTAATLRSIHRPLGASITNTALTQEDRREIDYTRIINGMEFSLPGEWFVDFSYMWAKAQRTTTDPSSIRSDLYQDLLRAGTWNPFGTRITNPGLVSPKDAADTANCFNIELGACTAGNSMSVRDQWDTRSVSTASASEKVVDLVASGELFDIGSNTIAAAIGAQFRDVEYLSFPDSLSSAGEDGSIGISGPVTGRQDVLAFFAEAVVPMGDIGEIQLAVRNEDYGGGVSTTDPKVSFEFGLGENFGARASWGTSFQAPTVRQTGSASSSGFVDDPASATGPGGSTVCTNQGVANNISVVVAGAPGLSPQEAENFSAGLIFQSDQFRASVDYFLFDYTDLIAAEAGFQAIVEAQCAGIENTGMPIIADPRVTRDSTGQVREVRSQFTNIGSVETSGIDLNADYTMDIGNGSLILDLGATYLLNFDVDGDGDGVQEFDGAGSRNFSNSFATMPEIRANAGATWFTGNHTARLGLNYIDAYHNDQGGTELNSWTSLDAMYAYTFSGLIGDGDTTLSIGGNNLTDQDPPALYQGDANGVREGRFNADGTYNRGWIDRPGYDSRAGHDLRGTTIYVRFKHAF